MYNGFFEWDDDKNALNLKKHGFDFWTAGLVFQDPNHLICKDRVDPETGEQRWHALGLVKGTVIILSHTYRKEPENEREIVHFVTAFEADKNQVKKYFTQNLG